MNVQPVKPRATAREFKCNEMFFSTTDLKGIILASNDVFVRVSGFTKEELIGRPHNIIRHPYMPRAAFFLLWENLKQALPFAGYVKNMAKDGSFYWVFVVVVPASNGRYLSIRFKPTSPLLGQVEALYKQMLAAENTALAGGGKEKDAVSAGLQVAVNAVQQLGYTSYDLLSHAALNQEMNSRDAQLRSTGTHIFPRTLSGAKGRESLVALYALGVQTYDQIDGLFRQLEGFVQLNRGLQERATSVLATSEDFRLHALNVNITSQRYGVAAVGVGIVATFLSTYSGQLTEGTGELRSHIAEIAHVTETINARIAMARLQMEMLLFFQAESAGPSGASDPRLIGVLEESFIASTTQVQEALARLQDNLPRLQTSRVALTRCALSIEMAQVRGLTEAARLPEGESLRTMFAEFRAKIGITRTQLDDLSKVIEQITGITSHTPRQVAAINSSTRQMRTGIEALAAA